MSRRGFSLIELLIVVVILGTVASFTVPMIRQGLESRRVAGARFAIATMNARAKAIAVQRSREVNLVIQNNVARLQSKHPVTGALTVLDRRDLFGLYGVRVQSSRDTVKYDPRGLGLQSSATTIVIARPGGFADTLQITTMGGVQ